MKKFTIFTLLQMIFISYAMADGIFNDEGPERFTYQVKEEKVFDAICVTKKELEKIKVVENKDGYYLVEYKNKELVYLDETCLEMPKNKCKPNEIPLFVQP